MTIEADLFQLVENLATSAGSRIYPTRLPQNATLPALVYQRLPGGNRVRSHSGKSGLANAQIQMTAWAATYTQTKTLGQEVISGLDSYNGGFASGPGNIMVEDGPDLFDPDSQLFYWPLTLSVWHEE